MLSVGTGFLYSFGEEAAAKGAPIRNPALITNKHVVEGADSVNICLNVAPRVSFEDEFGNRTSRFQKVFTVQLDGRLINHPSPDVDLCAISLFSVVGEVISNEQILDHAMLSASSQFFRKAEAKVAEPVVMVGYPRGLWDSVNNAPIVRRGITATHPFMSYEGRPEFLIDAACFPGSSGSPVFSHYDGLIRSAPNQYTPGERIFLLGILYAGPQFTAEGVLEARPIPHSASAVPVTSIPMNLGMVIHAAQLDVLAPLIRDVLT